MVDGGVGMGGACLVARLRKGLVQPQSMPVNSSRPNDDSDNDDDACDDDACTDAELIRTTLELQHQRPTLDAAAISHLTNGQSWMR